jgi:hypothetical protein
MNLSPPLFGMNVYYNKENIQFIKTKVMRNLGIVLILAGIVLMWVTGFNFITREKVVEVGPIDITSKKDNPVNWSPILGGIILVSGIAIVVVGNKKK